MRRSQRRNARFDGAGLQTGPAAIFSRSFTAPRKASLRNQWSGRRWLSLSYDQMKAELAKLHRDTIPPTACCRLLFREPLDAWAELHKKFGKLK